MALIDKTTDITSFDYKKVRKPNTTENGTFKTNQRNNSEKNTSFDEGRVQQQYTKLSPDEDQFLKKEPGDRYRGTNLDGGLLRGGAVLNAEKFVEDGARITKFLTTPKGLLFTGKQVILQKQNASKHTRGYKIISPITNRPPFTRDERHREGGVFGNPFSDVATYENGKDLSDIQKSQVNPITLKSKTTNKFVKLEIGKDTRDINTNLQDIQNSKDNELDPNFTGAAKDGNSLNKKLTNSKFELDVDFINFRIKDAVNNQFIQFPAYLTDITDNSSAEYNPTRYIGRPDQVFVYSGYTRNISFGFRVAALQKEDIPILWRKIERLKLLTLPTFSKRVIQDDNEERPVAPFVELTLGNLLVDQPGYFGSVNVTIPQTSTWELDNGFELPHICDVAIEFTFVGKATPQNLNLSHRRTSGVDEFKGLIEGPDKELSTNGFGYNIGTPAGSRYVLDKDKNFVESNPVKTLKNKAK